MEIQEISAHYGKHQAASNLTLDLDGSGGESINPDEGLSGRLKEARKQLGMSQATFATESGIPLKTFKKYETGSISPGAEALRAIMEMGISINWLLSGKGAALATDETPPPVDMEVLQGVIEGLEEGLKARKLTLSSEKKAHLIAVMYNYYRVIGVPKHGGRLPDLDQFMRLVT